MKKTTVISLILIALLIFTTSCSSSNTIEVTSKDYPKLTKMEPGEFDDNKLREATRSEYQYREYTCHLTLEDEKLCIENKTDYFSSTCEVGMNFGYLVGLDRGEFDGEFYCGTALGIYRYNPETGESLWYAMNYEKHVKQ